MAQVGGTGGLALLPSPLTCGLESALTGGQDVLVGPVGLVLGRDITNSRTKTDGVVVRDELGYDPPGVVRGTVGTRGSGQLK